MGIEMMKIYIKVEEPILNLVEIIRISWWNMSDLIIRGASLSASHAVN